MPKQPRPTNPAKTRPIASQKTDLVLDKPVSRSFSDRLEQFEKVLGLKFINRHLLRQVFVHRSYLNEHPDFDLDHNERLEFLGDAVLEFIVTEYLYLNYPNPEGELTNWRSSIVKGEMLSKVAKELSVNDFLLLSRGEQSSGGKARDLILANAFEALIGAVYLDQGHEAARNLVNRFLLIHLDEIITKRLYRDAKSSLQEWSQAKFNLTPIYQVINETGPDHAKIFTIGVHLGKRLVGQGTGPSKQKAEQAAAYQATERLNVNN